MAPAMPQPAPRLAAGQGPPPCHYPHLLQVDAVERFVVAHGQIILNQFQNYPGARRRCGALLHGLRRLACGRAVGQAVPPCAALPCSVPHLNRLTTPSPTQTAPAVKEVRNSAFVVGLKEHMAQLRHSKLYKQVGGGAGAAWIVGVGL